MSVGFSSPSSAVRPHEHLLWALKKTDHRAEVRARMTWFGPELRFLMWRGNKEAGDTDLLWSQVFRPEDRGGAALGELAEQKRRPPADRSRC
jgi:hypothetical protein